MKKLVLKLDGYVIKGLADVTPWGEGVACIEMKPFKVNNLKEIENNLNDNGFGVESINGGIIEVYRNYQGTLIYSRNLTIGKVSDYTKSYYFKDLNY